MDSFFDKAPAKEKIAALDTVRFFQPKSQTADNCTHTAGLAALRMAAILLKQFQPNDGIFLEIEEFTTYHAMRELQLYLNHHEKKQ